MISPAAKKTVEHLVSQVDHMFDITFNIAAFFKEEFLRERRWSALLYEQDFKDTGGRISSICSKFGFHRAISFSFGGAIEFFSAEIQLVHSELCENHRNYFIPSYTIFEIGGHFSIVSDSDYFWAIAGERSFLNEVCDFEPLPALDEFKRGIVPYEVSCDSNMKNIGKLLSSYHSVATRSWAE